MFFRFSAEERQQRDGIFALLPDRLEEVGAALKDVPRNSPVIEELLEKAVRDDNVELLSLACARIDNINKKRFFWGRTVAVLAAEMDRPRCLQRLVELGADLNVEDNDGDTVILKICGKTGNTATLEGAFSASPTREKQIPLLGWVDFISCGYNINHVNKNGQNAAVIAVLHNNAHLLKQLFNRGIDLQRRDKQGNAPAHHAVIKSMPDCLQLLIDLGCDVNLPQGGGTGDTLAHLAVLNPGTDFSYDCLRVLVRNDANLSIVNTNSTSACMLEVTYPISAEGLVDVQRMRGYPHARQVVDRARADGLIPKKTAFESGVATTTGPFIELGGFIAEGSITASSVTVGAIMEAAETTGSVLMMPLNALVSSPQPPATNG
jgi:ankyrin repeat protein